MAAALARGNVVLTTARVAIGAKGAAVSLRRSGA